MKAGRIGHHRRALVAAGAIAVAGVLLGTGSAALSARGSEGASTLLPDLKQEPPSGLVVTSAGGRFRLGFASAATNIGTGPLLIEGSRPNRRAATMRADQSILLGEGRMRHSSVGVLTYVVSSDHSHWHLTPFMRYELLRVDGSEVLGRSRKSGFCLGDRYDAGKALSGQPSEMVFTSRCGLHNPLLLHLREGISPGYGDDYDATLEGQYVDITDLRPGRYLLVHRVNGDGRLLESDYRNNTAWVKLAISWRGGSPRIAVLDQCDPETRPLGCESGGGALASARPARPQSFDGVRSVLDRLRAMAVRFFASAIG